MTATLRRYHRRARASALARRRPRCEHVFVSMVDLRSLPPLRAPGRSGGPEGAPLRARRAGAGGGARAGGGGGVGARRGLRGGSRHAAGGGACALSGAQRWCRRTPRGRAPCGATCSTGSRGSGRPWSPIAPGWPSSRRGRSRASTGTGSTACSRPPAGRSGRGRASGRRPAASRPTRRRCGPAPPACSGSWPRRGGRGGGAGVARVPRPAAGGAPAHHGQSCRRCPEILEQLGIRTLGELAALPSRALAERFGHPGLLALDLARGPRHRARAAPAARAGHASGSTCPRRPRASSSSGPWSCSWPGCSRGASGEGAP